jgi:hypothetical protein
MPSSASTNAWPPTARCLRGVHGLCGSVARLAPDRVGVQVVAERPEVASRERLEMKDGRVALPLPARMHLVIRETLRAHPCHAELALSTR